MEGIKKRKQNIREWLKKRHSQEELLESSIREEHGSNPVGNIEKRLSGSKRERLSEKTKRDNY